MPDYNIELVKPEPITLTQTNLVTVGGGNGTFNYNELINKPSINGVQLVGNKTTEDLGIVSTETDPTVPEYVKSITEENIENWNNKATTEYVNNEVNNVREVAEGKTKSFTIASLTDLGTLLGIDISTVSDEYTITNTTITYKEQSIELKQGDLFLIVDINVPDYWVSVDNMKIYKMETTKVDLTDYVKNTDYATGNVAGVVKVGTTYGTYVNSAGILRLVPATEEEINGKEQEYKPITPKTLDYAVKSVVGGHITLTQAEYDALVSAGTVDENTYYYIKEE